MKENIFNNKKVFILDMDGTIYLDAVLLDGSLDFLKKLKEKGYKYIFFTNNSSKSLDDYEKKIKALNIPCEREDICTSGNVTISFLKRERTGKSVYLLGTPSLIEGFKNEGVELNDENPDIVVLGFDTTLTYEKIFKSCNFIKNGAEFIATHPDSNCPAKEGFYPDAGAIAKMITESTGVEPLVMGKPNVYTIEAIEEATGCSRDELVMVGDRLNTDIALGFNHGVTTVLVLSGVSKIEDIEKTHIKADLVVDSVKDLIKLI